MFSFRELQNLSSTLLGQAGAIAVLNLLMMADLANHFSAIWTLSTRIGEPGGVYRHGSQWKTPLGLCEDFVNLGALKF